MARGLLSMSQAATRSAACGDNSRWSILDPLVAVPAAGLVVPIGVFVRLAVEDAEGVGEPQMQERAKPGARFRLGQRVVAEGDRVVDVVVGRDDVVVAGHHERDLAPQQLPRAGIKPIHPGELVGEFVGGDRVAVGQIEPRHPHLVAVAAKARTSM